MAKFSKLWLTSLLIVSIASGCSSTNTAPVDKGKGEEAIKNDPATIKIAVSNNMFTEEDFAKYVSEPVKKKYPHITVERINTSEKGSSVTDLIAAGTVPDIVGYYPGNLSNINDLNLTFNIEDLIKKHRFDTSRIAPEVLETVKIASNQSYIVGFAAYHNPFGLFYNKDVFDRMGIPYPKDNMTWDDLKELSVKITRLDNGIQYRGLYPDFLYRGARQLSLPYADFQTNKSLLNTDPWKELFQLWASMYDIPGMTAGDYKALNYGKNEQAFIKGELAMLAGYSNTLNALRKAPDVKWDVVTYPSNKKAPGVAHRVDSPVLAITSQSPNKDAAFQVLETILSDEVQTDMVRNGRMTVLTSQKVKDEFGKGIPEFNGKNLIALTKPKMAVISQIKYLNEGEIDKITTNAFQAVINKEKDVNTALREADELLNKHIETQLKNIK
ncbi:extracellular solute-binding protein [Paenibacillus sp. RC67]|uniref:ABC transporter substrate-binding protein n=1 Tax=Paenibacillus sp. RC67 TaxID=3039392 RepID=UPI0024AE1A88|nr:extracellular solute-binding protein [Paenibacillus sp. RC67]